MCCHCAVGSAADLCKAAMLQVEEALVSRPHCRWVSWRLALPLDSVWVYVNSYRSNMITALLNKIISYSSINESTFILIIPSS